MNLTRFAFAPAFRFHFGPCANCHHARRQRRCAHRSSCHQSLRPIGHGPHSRPLHRFLPIRLRQLDEEQSDSRRPGALGAFLLTGSRTQSLPALAGTGCGCQGSQIAAAKTIWRLLRLLHGHRRHREARRRAHRAGMEEIAATEERAGASRPCWPILRTTARPTDSSTSALPSTIRIHQSRSPSSTRAASPCPTAITTSSTTLTSPTFAPNISST